MGQHFICSNEAEMDKELIRVLMQKVYYFLQKFATHKNAYIFHFIALPAVSMQTIYQN